MDKRINLIINGKRDIALVLKNLHKLFESQDKVLIYTKSGKDEFISAIKDALHLDDNGVEAEVSFDKYNDIDYKSLKKNGTKKIIGVKMPDNLFNTISAAYNDAFKFVDKTEVAEFIHAFADDTIIVNDSSYDPEMYEWFMDTFDEPFIMDSKTNPGNYAFRKYSPRFVFISQSKLKNPISYVQFESKEHFIINRNKVKNDFDVHINRLYITEYIMRLHKMGIVRHPSFYPDPVIDTWVQRDVNIPFNMDVKELSKEYNEDNHYISEVLKGSLAIENSVDPIVKELGDIIENKLKDVNNK